MFSGATNWLKLGGRREGASGKKLPPLQTAPSQNPILRTRYVGLDWRLEPKTYQGLRLVLNLHPSRNKFPAANGCIVLPRLAGRRVNLKDAWRRCRSLVCIKLVRARK